jgi:nucleoside-diphosphate-sugar epimerase
MPIYQYGNTLRDYTHVSNIVKANILTMNTMNINTIYNISGNLKLSLDDIAKHLNITPIKKEFKIEDIQICTANIQKAIDELNYVPKTFEGLNLKD